MSTLTRRIPNRVLILTIVCWWGSAFQVVAAAKPPQAKLPIAALQANAEIPTLKKVLGYDWGQQFTSYENMERYLDTLTRAAPNRTRLVRYGESYEHRGLFYLVISSAKNMQQIEEIRAGFARLADPRVTSANEAKQRASELPALVWLACSVHGNELSSTDAALVTAYHLLADQRPETAKLLDQLVVIIDPLQNPDGRQRFINNYRETGGVIPSAEPLATEHAERWPGGRFNHYLFDLNRDWFLHSQQETVAKVRAYLQWHPQIYIDAHEMGHNGTYFFTPPTEPANEFVTAKQKQWFMTLGQQQASWFDRFGFAYTTREVFDAFYPGYGTDWPTAQGAIGVLWEQAGVRGLVVNRDDETQLHYRDTVLHHYIGALATLDIAAKRKTDLLRDYYAIRADAVALGRGKNAVQNYFLPVAPRPNRTARLARLLISNGIDVYRTESELELKATDTRHGDAVTCIVPRGSYQVPVAQGGAHLIRLLLDRKADMGKEFVDKQLQRKSLHLPAEIYDVTAWSLPLAFDVPCLATGPAPLPKAAWNGKPNAEQPKLTKAQVAYLVPPSDGAIKALAAWLQQGVRVHVNDEEFTLGKQDFPRGTLILKVAENHARLHRVVVQAARQYELQVTCADTGFVTRGAHFGGPHVKWVRTPKILLATGDPAQSSVGDTWYLFDQVLRYPTTRVSFRNLAKIQLADFNVIIIPDGSYSDPIALNEALGTRLMQWTKEGGTLVLLKGAAAWATCDQINILPSKRLRKGPAPSPQKADQPAGPPSCKNLSKEADQPFPDTVPGVFLQADTFAQHWLTFACSKTFGVFFRSNVIFAPLNPEKGRNVVTFAARDDLVLSGFCWPETEKLLPDTPYLMYRELGKGHVVGFADDPNYRAMFPSLQRLFINAVMFGPGE